MTKAQSKLVSRGIYNNWFVSLDHLNNDYPSEFVMDDGTIVKTPILSKEQIENLEGRV